MGSNEAGVKSVGSSSDILGTSANGAWQLYETLSLTIPAANTLSTGVNARYALWVSSIGTAQVIAKSGVAGATVTDSVGKTIEFSVCAYAELTSVSCDPDLGWAQVITQLTSASSTSYGFSISGAIPGGLKPHTTPTSTTAVKVQLFYKTSYDTAAPNGGNWRLVKTPTTYVSAMLVQLM
jgi:hypothetical protein